MATCSTEAAPARHGARGQVRSNYSTGYSRAPGFLGIKAPDRLASRYLTEDVASTMREEAPRTLGSRGLEGLSDEQLLSL